MDYDLAGLPERLKTLRIERGLTQMQLADRLGMKQPMIGRWERGVHPPTLQNAVAVCQALDVSLDELCGRIDG